jgi:SAM-dependent methyltransferase
MKVIHVLRNPCSEGTVAANVLKWGTGALNIDRSRVAHSNSADLEAHAKMVDAIKTRGGTMENSWKNTSDLSGASDVSALGRWPANLILQHLSGCQAIGFREEPGYSINRFTDGMKPFGNGAGHEYSENLTPPCSVPVWRCVFGCPVANLERQSGGSEEVGGASRYFKQFQGAEMNTELAEYLRTMISPEERTLTTTEGGECVYLHIDHPDTFPWAEHSDDSVHGMTVETESLAGIPNWMSEAHRILKPGAHLLLAAPDEEPTGHTGACIAEDAGFEVRDAILWVHGEGAGEKLHYTPKAARAEREEGLFDSDFEYGQQDESRKEGNPGGDNPRNRGLTKRKNVHPTVKPVDVMVRLLADVPKDGGPVVDPFLGSGTTLLACIETGHDGIGIEREREYLEIADARVRHRDYETAGWNRAHIVSDVAPALSAEGGGEGDGSKQEQSLDDFFGL